ncbi:MAG: cardiolipin synthase [Clostridiales bacterium]|nr:cardiolipin synthase [Clostridiales bacterium]
MIKKNLYLLLSLTVISIAWICVVIFEVGFSDIFNFFYILISRFFLLYAVIVAIFIFLDNDDPHRTLSWLMVLILLPYLGIVLYVLFGKNLRSKKVAVKKRISDMSIEERVAESQTDAINYFESVNQEWVLTQHKKIIKLLLKNSNSLFSFNNRIDVLTNGKATFGAIIDRLEKAEETIHFEFFIIKNDQIGNEIKDILIKKAKEGVKVRVIYDAVGSIRLGKIYKMQLKEAGVEVFPFYPVAFPLITRKLNFRNHRKIIVVDGSVGFVGGLNVGDEYLGKNEKLGFWRDTHLMIAGEGVQALQKIFISDWKFVSNEKLAGELLFKKSSYESTCMMQIAASGPDNEWQNIHQGYFSLIATAKERIWITTPYLVPDESLKMALKTAALSGVDVKIIIPSKADHFFVYWASRDNLEGLLEAGVEIYTYEKGFIHSKILLIDGIAASVGTANMDNRSFGINFEVNAFIYGKVTIERLEKDFIEDLEVSKLIDLEEYNKRNLKEKIFEAIGRLVSSVQ